MSTQNAIVLKRGREKPVRQGHPWIFSGAIDRLPVQVADGAVADVVSSDGEWLARGYVNRRSQIQVRLLTWKPDETVDDAFWARRLHTAISARSAMPELAGATAYRLVNAESDRLPGLTVDRYGDFLVMQAGTLAIDQHKAHLAAQLLALTGCAGIVERSEMATRRQEGLNAASGLLTGAAPPDRLEVAEGGLRFLVDLAHGQKTGFYTDQRENRRRVATYCRGRRVLNAFSYTGAFAVYALANGASHVTNVDSSVEALELAEANLALNGFDPDRQSAAIAGDVFDVLRDWQSGLPGDGLPGDGQLFDLIVLDPPKFAHSQAQVERALRGYKEINRLAFQLLRPGGVLATFSCSGLVSADLFQKVVFSAALDALGPGQPPQILAGLRQSSDHPVSLTFPEAEYLKGLICRVGA
jgi:23S rRNA (cytosine1962-C5)-methyltransferase